MTEPTKLECRVVKLCVVPEGEPIFSEQATFVEIDDDAAGEYVKVTQHGGHIDNSKSLAIDPTEWPAVKAAIDRMIAECRSEG